MIEVEYQTIKTFADDTAVFAESSVCDQEIRKLLFSMNKVRNSTEHWKIELN